MYLTHLIKLANKLYDENDQLSVSLIHKIIHPYLDMKLMPLHKKAESLLPTLILIRHGETSMNSSDDKSKEVLRGWCDVPLKDDMGYLQAEKLAAYFHNLPIASIYTSDLQRAHFTAKSIQRLTDAPLTISPSLRPWNMGVNMDGKPVQEYVPIMLEYIKRDSEIIPGSNESFKMFQRRCLSKLQHLMNKAINEPEKGFIVAVAHSRNCRLLKSWILAGCKDIEVIDKEPMNNKEDPVSTGGFMTAQYIDGKWQLVTLPGEEEINTK